MLAGQIPYVLQVAGRVDNHARRTLDEWFYDKAAGLLTIFFYEFFTASKVAFHNLFLYGIGKRMTVKVWSRNLYGIEEQPVKSFMKQIHAAQRNRTDCITMICLGKLKKFVTLCLSFKLPILVGHLQGNFNCSSP